MAAAMMDLVLSNTGDANFRTWGKAVSDRLAAFGWVKTADTGQIDWATVTTPSAYNTARGYEVWRMADALQAQAPVFMKLEYGSGSGGSPAALGIWITLGTATNGAGTLTGQVGTRVQFSFSNEPSSTVAYRCVFSGDPGRFGMCLGVNTENANVYLWVVVERSKDAAGADTAEGVYRCGASWAGWQSQFLPMTGIVPANENNLGCMGPGAGTGMSGSDVVLYPIYPFNIDMKPPIRGAAGYFKSDLPQDYTVQGSIYGLTQTFYTVGHQVTGPFSRPGGSSGNVWNGLALRYE